MSESDGIDKETEQSSEMQEPPSININRVDEDTDHSYPYELPITRNQPVTEINISSKHDQSVFKKPSNQLRPPKCEIPPCDQLTSNNEKSENSTNCSTSDSSNPENFEVVLSVDPDRLKHSPSKLNEATKVPLIAEEDIPSFYDIKGRHVSKSFRVGQLPDAFGSISSKYIVQVPDSCDKNRLKELKQQKLRELFGNTLKNDHFEKLQTYCSPDNLRNGLEITMDSNYPLCSFAAMNTVKDYFANSAGGQGRGDHLHTIRKYKLRVSKDITNYYARKLKYRGLRFLPMPEVNPDQWPLPQQLVPGKDLLFRVRLYRPFLYSPREKIRSGHRHPLLCSDLVLTGRNTLEELRDHIPCVNDDGLRIDVSNNPEETPLSNCKELFPSGFLYINGTFYVDTRAGCSDHSAVVRAWTRSAPGWGGHRPAIELCLPLHQLTLKLGYPEVYVHQGNCEHLFTFSEVRLVGPDDPLDPTLYPRTTIQSKNYAVYCTTCAEFAAKWIVTECPKVPFDPAFFCDTCFNLYLYKDGKKLGEFKAFPYKNNQ